MVWGKSSPTVEAIDSLGQLRPDWDSYGANPVAESARKLARDFIIGLEQRLGNRLPTPAVGPTPDGGVAVVWRRRLRPNIAVFFSSEGGKYVITRDHKLVDQGRVEGPESFAREIVKP